MLTRPAIIRVLPTLLILLCATASCGKRFQSTVEPRASFAGFASEEALLDAFVAAVSANDRAAMDRVRVTELEYRDVIIPGTAPVGKTMQGPLSERKFRFFWGMLNGKSRDYADVILHQFGGRSWHRTRHWYAAGEQQYSGYKALNEVRIAVVDDAGNSGTIRSGTVADVGGRYKFIGFQYDSD